MSQFPSASLHRVDPGSRPDIAERNSQGRSGRAPGSVDFGALLDRMSPRSPEPAELPDRVEEPAATGRAAPDRELRRARELLSTARNERHQPPQEARAQRRDDEAGPAEASTPSIDATDTASVDARAPGDDGATPRRPADEAAPDARDAQAPGTDGQLSRAETDANSGTGASGGSRDEAIEQAALVPEQQAEPARATPTIDIATDPAAATLLALGLPAQQVQVAPVATMLPAADLLAGTAASAEPITPTAGVPAAMAAAIPAAPMASGQPAGSASDPAFGTMLQAQAAAQPREVQAAPQQPRFPEAAQSAPAAEVAQAARAAVSAAPVLAQAVPAQALSSQSMDSGADVAATQQVAAAAAPASPAVATTQVQVAVATPTLAAATSQERAGAPSTTVDPAQQFAIELEAPQAEGTPQAQPSASTPAAARPQQGAPAPVAAQLVAQGQAVDATAQPQAQAQSPASMGQATGPLAKANADAPALAVAEATASTARKDAPEAAQAAQLPAPAARAEATPEAAAARGARMPAHPAVAQVAVSVAKAAQDGVERITIKLQPPELGRIDVKIEVGVDGRIQAVFAAERAATVDILQREVRELERALQGAGLDAGGGLSFGLKQNGGNGGQGAYAGLERGQGGSGRGAPEEDARQQQQPRRMATADGRVDIHV